MTKRNKGAARASVVSFALAAAAVVSLPAWGATKHFVNVAGGSWSLGANWSPASVPGPGDEAIVGGNSGILALPSPSDQVVTLASNVAVSDLRLRLGMELRTQGNTLYVDDFTEIIGGGVLRVTNAVVGSDFDTFSVHVAHNGSALRLEGGAALIRGQLTLASDGGVQNFNGDTGLVQFTGGGTTLSNSGHLVAGPGFLHFFQLGGGLYDLDGAGTTGELVASGVPLQSAQLAFNGTALADDFGGAIRIGTNARVAINLTSPWTVSPAGLVVFRGVEGSTEPTLAGAMMHLNGTLVVQPFLAESMPFPTPAVVEAPTTFHPGAAVTVEQDCTLDFVEPVTVLGGNFTLAQGAMLEFTDDTVVRGGHFTTHSASVGGGFVRFSGPTEYDGDLTVDGVAVQFENATVTGPTTVTADVFDLDGTGTADWSVNHPLVLNVGAVDTLASNAFDADLSVAGGATAKLTVNLTGPMFFYALNGDTTLSGSALAAFPIERLAGSPVSVGGELTVEHRVRVSADMALLPASSLLFSGIDARLQVTGRAVVHEGAGFGSLGTLETGTTGELILDRAVNTNGVVVLNRGLLEVGDPAGTTRVRGLTQATTGRWLVDLGGYAVGTETDLLIATGGGVALDGMLLIRHLDLGAGTFHPVVGDRFTILTSVTPLTGTFVGDPVSFVGSTSYHWVVEYHTNRVMVRLAEVVPEPAVAGVLLPAFALLARRRP